MKTFCLCSCLNERDSLERMWESVQTHIPGEVVLVVVDGKFRDIDYPEDFSSDGTKEYAQANGHYIPVVELECEKRTAGLEFIDSLATDGDWILSLDADETLTSIFGWPERVGSISFDRKSGLPVTYGRCRLYRWEPGLHFKYRHFDLYSADGTLVSSLEDAPDYQVIGSGDHFEKPRTPEKVAYYRTLREREGHPSVPRCSRGCCSSQMEHYRSVQLSPSCLPTRRDSRYLATDKLEKGWQRDIPAYARLVKDGIQPPQVDGCADVEARAETKEQIEETV